MGLVPRTFPPIPGCLPFDLYAILEPAREIGGDFYDYWLNGRENLMLVIGDVSGKGIPAALFMAVCRTYLRAFSRSVREPAMLLEYLNNEVSRHNETCMFVTLICAMVHIPTGLVTYANAGHNPPFLRRRDGGVRMLEFAEDMPVGFVHGAQFATKTLKLETGDSILFYTDGMPEAFNDEGGMLGEEESLALFKSSGAGSCRTAIGQLRAEVSEFTDGAEQSDDITMLMYGQLDQSSAEVDLSVDRDLSDSLEGETGIFSLSDLNASLPRPKNAPRDSELGLSLSGLAGRR
jgi:sigma-B regulation protein RsbU (phosphoserine phosphatase)